jgi:hypothetical protein
MVVGAEILAQSRLMSGWNVVDCGVEGDNSTLKEQRRAAEVQAGRDLKPWGMGAGDVDGARRSNGTRS